MTGPAPTFHAEHKAPDFTPAARTRLELRMWNWARYTVDSPGDGKGVCGSAEKYYTPPREDEERFVRSAMPIDVADALRIEDAVARLSKPAQRSFLVSWFCYRSLPEIMARRFRVPELMLGHYLWLILGAVQHHLDHMPVAARKTSGYKSA
jgi:hypothetical protein